MKKQLSKLPTKQAFDLPAMWEADVQARLSWCQNNFGRPSIYGPWLYNPVTNQVVFRNDECATLYLLRWS